jgi:hypothetical protein
MQESKEIKRRIAGISRWLLLELRLLFFSLVSSDRELQKSFASPATRPAATFHGTYKIVCGSPAL